MKFGTITLIVTNFVYFAYKTTPIIPLEIGGCQSNARFCVKKPENWEEKGDRSKEIGEIRKKRAGDEA